MMDESGNRQGQAAPKTSATSSMAAGPPNQKVNTRPLKGAESGICRWKGGREIVLMLTFQRESTNLLLYEIDK